MRFRAGVCMCGHCAYVRALMAGIEGGPLRAGLVFVAVGIKSPFMYLRVKRREIEDWLERSLFERSRTRGCACTCVCARAHGSYASPKLVASLHRRFTLFSVLSHPRRRIFCSMKPTAGVPCPYLRHGV